MPDPDVLSIQRDYPLVFHACHVDHVRASSNAHQVSARESTILAHLDPQRPASPGQLAQHLGVGASALSASIARLATLGYVERRVRAGDRRHVELRLTAEGTVALQAGSVLDTERLTALLGHLTPRERVAAKRGLALLARAAKRLREEHGGGRAEARRRVSQRMRRKRS